MNGVRKVEQMQTTGTNQPLEKIMTYIQKIEYYYQS